MSSAEADQRPAWPLWFFRIATTLAALLLFDQAIFAGQYLSGVYAALATHATMGTISAAAVLGCVAGAIVLGQYGGVESQVPLFGSLGLFALTALQMFVGYRHLLALHIPLGVLVTALSLGLAVSAWRARW